jgi:transposase
VERGCGLDRASGHRGGLLVGRLEERASPEAGANFWHTTRELLALREWLLAQGCTHVAMESTGVYWKPVFAVLEGEGLEIVVANAQHVKKVPGRKTRRLSSLQYCPARTSHR